MKTQVLGTICDLSLFVPEVFNDECTVCGAWQSRGYLVEYVTTMLHPTPDLMDLTPEARPFSRMSRYRRGSAIAKPWEEGCRRCGGRLQGQHQAMYWRALLMERAKPEDVARTMVM